MIMEAPEGVNIAVRYPGHQSAYTLMRRGKRGAAALIAVECGKVEAESQSGREQDPDDAALVRCKLLDDMLDILLNPYDAIGEWNNIDWLRWLMAGGKTLDEFSSSVKEYDYGTCCGLVWTANYVAYRCRTCSISPCMSLCGECFKRGDHTGHDFNMFRSQAGGACDCGDPSVMKPNGFCRKHSTINLDGTKIANISVFKQPPPDLLRVAERILPRLLLRLVQYLRENSKIADSRSISSQHIASASGGNANQQQHHLLLADLDPFLGMLHDLSALGAAMRRVMTVSLTNEKIYTWACEYYTHNSSVENNSNNQQPLPQQSIYNIYTFKVHQYYTEAINQYTSYSSRRRRHSNASNIGSNDTIIYYSDSEDSDEFEQDDMMVDGQNKKDKKRKLDHSSFLQEIVFWTVRYEFPQKIVCFLLNMLPDAAYKESLTEAFVMHYGCVARVLATTRDSDTLSNHIVHISVQLFSNEALATRMVDKLGLLRIMVSSLRRMMTKILIPSTLHDATKNRHRVVDCSKTVMKEHCYWPLVSDLNNVLSHRPIAVKFMCDDRLLDAWFSYLSMFQGMNVNCQELGHHVEFEPNTYYAAFSAELEASAYPMWAMLSHLTSAETWPLTSRVLRACLQRLRKWLTDVGFYEILDNQYQGVNLSSSEVYINNFTTVIRKLNDSHQFTFHLPLHRYLAVFLCQAVRTQGARVEDIIPIDPGDIADRDALLLAIATHPVRAQAAFYEIMQGTWVRNGLQIKGQAMTYIQSNFCISMVDADIYLLQLCISELSDVNMFLALVYEKFKAYDWMRVIKYGGLPQIMDSVECSPTQSMESLLVFLATLVGVRTNLCSDKDYDYCQSQLEMVTLLCVSDKTHSHLMELMPERCGGGVNASSVSNSTSNINNTENNSSQESPSPLRDFETVLQAVAEYKRPQFEASGNMQQGFYIPLPHVWEKLYDPVHVLLRAVHRRDFQSSMDRYATHMRSIGLLQQNQSPWPPFRQPQIHHSAYQDPRRALLSKLFHSVAWHCLYRSNLFKDVSDHSLSILVYLLDQAWTCYKSSNTTTNLHQEPMDTQQNMYSAFDDSLNFQKHIKITAAEIESHTRINDTFNDQSSSHLLLNHWYDTNDIVSNLCTTITHIELPPPYLQYYLSAGNSNDINTSAPASPTLTTNLLDYFSSTATNTSPPITVTSTDTGISISQQPNIPSLAAIASNEILGSRSGQSSSATTRPPFYSLNAAAAATSSTMDSALNHVKQTFQLLCPLQLAPSSHPQLTNSIDTENQTNDNSSSSEVVSSEQEHCFGNSENVPPVKIDDDKNSFIIVNESIISLLLKLHSHLSGVPDSYLPPPYFIDEELDQKSTDYANDQFQNEIPLCGDGPFYVSRLLDKLAKGSKLCYECIIRSRMALWPEAVVMREAATREDEERERRERKRRARDKQLQMMNEMANAQRAFLESARRSGDLDSSDIDLPLQSSSTTVTNMECDEPSNIMDLSSSFTSNNEITATLSNEEVHVLDEISNTNTTAKHSIVRSIHQQKLAQTVDCVICNQTIVVQPEQQRLDPVGLVILVQGTNILAHRRHIIPPISPNNEENLTRPKEHQQIEKSSTVTNSINTKNDENAVMEEDEQNYYHYWPVLPPIQPLQNHHQNSTENESDQHHKPLVTTIIDDEDMSTYASHSDRRKSLLTQYFDPLNLDLADLDIGALTTTTSPTPISGSVHVQTCGHHLHLRCWNAYLSSLRGAQRFNSDRGEYSCPLCRQLANSLMPLIPAHASSHLKSQGLTLCDKISGLTDIISEQESSDKRSTLHSTYISDISGSDIVTGLDLQIHNRHLHDDNAVMNPNNDDAILDHVLVIDDDNEDESTQNEGDSLLNAVNRCVNTMISTTVVTASSQRDRMYRMKWYNVVSVAWTNIQVELVQRNNTLIEHSHQPLALNNHDNNTRQHTNSMTENNGTNIYYDILPKRNCIAQLLKVLSVSAQSLMMDDLDEDKPISAIWYKLIGIEQSREIGHVRDPPLLMRDPCSVLLQLVLLLPNLERDLFDTLVQITFNMQIFVAALKVATAWNQHSQPHKTESSVSTENDQNSSAQTNLNDCASDESPFSSSIDTKGDDFSSPLLTKLQLKSPSAPLFSQAVAYAKSIVFLSQDNENVVNSTNYGMKNDDFLMDHDDFDVDQVPLVTSENNEVNLSMLESYGRQCTLPFMRFATLLKNYTYGENIDHFDGLHDFTTMSSLKQINLNFKQKNQQLDNQMESSHDNRIHLPQSVEANHTNNILIENSSLGTQPLNHHNWSQDDHEFLILAQYLNLLNSDKESKACGHNEENKVNDCENNQNYDISENKNHLLHQPPSALEAVNWPKWACYDSGGKDNVQTTLSRIWLSSFRDALIHNSKSVIIAKSTAAIDFSAVSDIDPNCSSTNTNIIMAARMLLLIDCCKGSGMYNYGLLPTVNWTGPRLLRLPNLYDDVFQYYHGRPCHRCHGIPRETSVCLLCGTVVCLKENCCKTNNIYEAVQHSLECGGGTGMFLVVTSSSVVVIRGKRACLWGSVYLDAFGEEDRELKRGKPLYLSPERYRLLERQWLAHRFDHTNKKWVWHRDAL